MPYGWEGNRRSGVALVVRHRFMWFIHLRAHGLRAGGEHPAYTPHGVWHSFIFLLNPNNLSRYLKQVTGHDEGSSFVCNDRRGQC